MQLLDSLLGATGDLLVDLWLYMALGFLVAGAVEEFVSEETLLGYVGTNEPLAILRGVLAGFVVSACACGTIPLVASLRNRGAPTATSLALLLASPWLGIPMLLLYVSFLGWGTTFGLYWISTSPPIGRVSDSRRLSNNAASSAILKPLYAVAASSGH